MSARRTRFARRSIRPERRVDHGVRVPAREPAKTTQRPGQPVARAARRRARAARAARPAPPPRRRAARSAGRAAALEPTGLTDGTDRSGCGAPATLSSRPLAHHRGQRAVEGRHAAVGLPQPHVADPLARAVLAARPRAPSASPASSPKAPRAGRGGSASARCGRAPRAAAGEAAVQVGDEPGRAGGWARPRSTPPRPSRRREPALRGARGAGDRCPRRPSRTSSEAVGRRAERSRRLGAMGDRQQQRQQSGERDEEGANSSSHGLLRGKQRARRVAQ